MSTNVVWAVFWPSNRWFLPGTPAGDQTMEKQLFTEQRAAFQLIHSKPVPNAAILRIHSKSTRGEGRRTRWIRRIRPFFTEASLKFRGRTPLHVCRGAISRGPCISARMSTPGNVCVTGAPHRAATRTTGMEIALGIA